MINRRDFMASTALGLAIPSVLFARPSKNAVKTEIPNEILIAKILTCHHMELLQELFTEIPTVENKGLVTIPAIKERKGPKGWKAFKGTKGWSVRRFVEDVDPDMYGWKIHSSIYRDWGIEHLRPGIKDSQNPYMEERGFTCGQQSTLEVDMRDVDNPDNVVKHAEKLMTQYVAGTKSLPRIGESDRYDQILTDQLERQKCLS